MVAIALTTAALVIILSAMNGLTNTVAGLYNALEPDLRVSALNAKRFVSDPADLKRIRALHGVEGISQTLSDKALLKHGEKQALVQIRGVDEAFSSMTKLDSILTGGFNGIRDSSKNFILLGRGLAELLGYEEGSFSQEIQVYSPKRGRSTSINPEEDILQFNGSVCGQFTLNDELDYQTAFVNLRWAREIFGNAEGLSTLEIACEEPMTDEIHQAVKEIMGKDYEVLNRYQLNDVLFKSLETEKLATFIILAFILVIATFNLIGALTMLIIEKRKDIKTLYSIGADRRIIRGIFIREGLFISGIGAGLGLLTGLFVCWLQIRFHLVSFGSEFIIPYYPIDVQIGDLLKVFALIMCISFLAGLYPVRVFTRSDLLHAKEQNLL